MRSRRMGMLAAFALVATLIPLGAAPAGGSASGIVISQVYGGGGNSGATYTHDFVELFNAGQVPVSLAGWSVQYASATGSGTFGANSGQITELPSISLAPGQYLLIQEAQGSGGTTALPLPDVTDSTPINMSGTGGKVALASITVSLGCNGESTPCTSEQLAKIVDLVGWDGANFYEGSPAPATSNATAVLRAGGGCTDTDSNQGDFGVGAPTPRNTSTPVNVCVENAPEVSSTFPADGATDMPVGGNLTITFSEPVDVAGAWFDLTCSTTGSKTAVVSGGPTTFTIDPDTDFVDGESCTLTVSAAGVTDQDTNDPPDNMTDDFVIGFAAFDVCLAPYTPIYAIQGSGEAAAIIGPVTTKGIVVGDYEGPSPALRGFYVQDPSGDDDQATSDGIFVFNGNSDDVSLGQVVRVSGNAGEFQDQTQISSVSSIVACGTGSVTPSDVMLPFASAIAAERYEGMLVRLPQTLYVTEHFQLGRFGQVVVSSGGRLQQPTNEVAPGAPALALQAQNDLNRIIIDDDLNNQNPDPILFGRGGASLSASNTLRGGDTATETVGVMTYTWAGNSASGNAYRVRPISALGGYVNFEPTNHRPSEVPDVGGRIQVAGMNLLNFFNTFDGIPDTVDNCTNGVGGTATDCRGADDQGEFDRQVPKTVEAIVGTGAEVVGLVELENDGYGPDSAIADLVDALNTATAPGTYAFIDADAATNQVNALGLDAIKVGLIYQPAMVSPVGQTAALNTVEFVNAGDGEIRNRPALAQAFVEAATGARFVVAVNHLKSKGSACDEPDAGDGQGNCNEVRTTAAGLLADWLAGDPTGAGDADILIVGDLNSYAKEDPIALLEGAGYTNLIAAYGGADAYSYVFDGQWGYLDHALGSATLSGQVTGVAEWHINADEPSVLDYNTNFKSSGQITSLYADDEFRMSDHDPVIIGLDLAAYDFDGFYRPLDNPPAKNKAKAGSAIPVKFSLGGFFGLDVLADGTPAWVACGSTAFDGDAVMALGTGALQYDLDADQYVYVVATDKTWTGECRQLVLVLADGSIHRVEIEFK